jgi:hypothetical protein
MAGLMFVPPTRYEKVAACAEHGFSPRNTRSIQARDAARTTTADDDS